MKEAYGLTSSGDLSWDTVFSFKFKGESYSKIMVQDSQPISDQYLLASPIYNQEGLENHNLDVINNSIFFKNALTIMYWDKQDKDSPGITIRNLEFSDTKNFKQGDVFEITDDGTPTQAVENQMIGSGYKNYSFKVDFENKKSFGRTLSQFGYPYVPIFMMSDQTAYVKRKADYIEILPKSRHNKIIDDFKLGYSNAKEYDNKTIADNYVSISNYSSTSFIGGEGNRPQLLVSLGIADVENDGYLAIGGDMKVYEVATEANGGKIIYPNQGNRPSSLASALGSLLGQIYVPITELQNSYRWHNITTSENYSELWKADILFKIKAHDTQDDKINQEIREKDRDLFLMAGMKYNEWIKSLLKKVNNVSDLNCNNINPIVRHSYKCIQFQYEQKYDVSKIKPIYELATKECSHYLDFLDENKEKPCLGKVEQEGIYQIIPGDHDAVTPLSNSHHPYVLKNFKQVNNTICATVNDSNTLLEINNTRNYKDNFIYDGHQLRIKNLKDCSGYNNSIRLHFDGNATSHESVNLTFPGINLFKYTS